MAEYNNEGKVSLWTNESENPRAPAYKGKAYAHRDIKKGEEIAISLWNNASDNPKAPALRGDLQDKRERQSDENGYDWKAAEDRQRSAKAPERETAPAAFDDDIPF